MKVASNKWILFMSNIVSILQRYSSSLKDQHVYQFLHNQSEKTIGLTYEELDQKARNIASWLQQRNMKQQRILLLFPTGFDFITAFFGCLYAEAIAIPMHCHQSGVDFEHVWNLISAITDDASIAVLITTATLLPLVKEYFAKNHSHKKIVISTLTDLMHDSHYLPSKIKNDTIAYLQYTSGSTSSPKAAIIRHQNLIHNIKYSGKAWRYSAKSVTLTWAPHSHVYGLVCGLLVPLYNKSPTILLPPLEFIKRPLCWLEAISKYKVTHSGGPNFAYDLCVQKINDDELQTINLKKWKVAINGGENVSYQTLINFYEKFKKYGFKYKSFCAAYGMSELSGTIAVGQYQKKPVIFSFPYSQKNNLTKHKCIANGRLLPGLEAIIVDPDLQKKLPDGKLGEIWLQGKSLVSGYWGQDGNAEECFRTKLVNSKTQTYFKTGDLGFIKKNQLCVAGRLKDVIISHGKKYLPSDLEVTVAQCLNHMIVGNYRIIFSVVRDDKEEIVLLQEISANNTAEQCDEISKIIRAAITEQHRLDIYALIFVAENSLPRTASGKLQRKLCKQQYLNHELSIMYQHAKDNSFQKKNTSEQHERYEQFIKIVANVLKINVDKINANDSLTQYGFDSISITELTEKINTHFQLHLSPPVFYESPTLSEFFAHHISSHKTHSSKKQSPLIKTNEIAIIGMAGLFPNAANVQEFWQNLIDGKNCITEFPSKRLTNLASASIKWGGFLDNIAQFDAAFFNISPREAELMDPQQRLFLQIVWHAIEDAGYATQYLSQVKTGLFVGVFSNDYAELLQKNAIEDAYLTTGITHSILANRVSYLLNLQGPSEAIDTACSSSLVAIHRAVLAIQNGDCDMAIVGGVNALLSSSPYIATSKAGMLSEDGQCKTFDKNANGYVRGEGVGALILKPLSLAQQDNDIIYAVIKGTAVNHGGHVSSLTAPNPNAQAEVIVQACKRAEIQPDSMTYIETHGTGTSLGDPIEINGLKKAFNNLAEQNGKSLPHYYCALGALKTHIGHLESSAGIASVIKVLLCMKHKKIPANLNFSELNPYIELQNSPFYLANKNLDWQRHVNQSGNSQPLTAGVSGFGFGGTNAHIILEEAPFVSVKKSMSDFPVYMLALSAKTSEALHQRVKDLQNWLLNNSDHTLNAICYTLNVGRNHFEKRCVIIVENITQLQDALSAVIRQETHKNVVINYDDRIHYKTRAVFQDFCGTLMDELTVSRLSQEDYRKKLFLLANFYIEGYELDWLHLYKEISSRISLPGYPFAKDYFWIPQKTAVQNKHAMKSGLQESSPVKAKDYLIQLLIHQQFKIPLQHLHQNANFSELGLDSIAIKELSSHLSEVFNCEVKPSLFFEYTTPHALGEYLSTKAVTKFAKTAKPHLQPNYDDQSIAIIGMQAYLPQSKNLQEFWQQLLAGKDFVTEVPRERWNWRDYYGDSKQDTTKTNSKWGSFIHGFDTFDASFFNISAREANLMDPQHRLMLEIIWQTIEDAGYDPFSFNGMPVGLFLGAEFNEYQTLIQSQKKIFHGHIATGNSHSLLANRISYFLNLQGPSEVINTACSSSLVAIHNAIKAIRNNECSMALAGGVSLILNPETYVITSQLGALSAHGRCKTFDKSANGYVKGEGVAAVLLKPLAKAEEDGDNIYAILKSSAVNHGGKAQSLTAPNVATQSQLLVNAYTQANIDVRTVTYIETHGTGTELGDPIEIDSLKKAFNELLSDSEKIEKSFCGLGAVKTNIGHLEPASGMAGIIKVLLSLRHEQIPGNLHCEEQNPFIQLQGSPFYLINETQDWHNLIGSDGEKIPRRAGVSSFGFGGTCAHLVLEEFMTNKVENINAVSPPLFLIPLSAKQLNSLEQKLQDLYEWLQQTSEKDIQRLSYTLCTGRAHFDLRSVFIVNSMQELVLSLQKYFNGESLQNYFSNAHKKLNTVKMQNHYQSLMSELDAIQTMSAEIYREKLFKLANLYIENYPIEWQRLFHNSKIHPLSLLPAYPFCKQRYWFDMEIASSSIPESNVENASIDEVQDLHGQTISFLKEIFAQKLRLKSEQISTHDTYEVYGVDSLLGLEITNQLEKTFGVLPKTLLYERNNLEDLARYFQQYFQAALQNLFNISTSTSRLQNQKTAAAPLLNKSQTYDSCDIAIIGLDIHFPQAKNIHEFWNNLRNARDCITEIPSERWNYHDYPIEVGGEKKYFKYGGFIDDIDKFDPLFFNISPREASLMDPQERLFMQSAWATFEDAGYTRTSLQRLVNNEVGVFAGVTYNFYPLFIAEEWFKNNRQPLDVQLFSIANRISYFLNLKGPSFIVDTACSSSLAAIHLACQSILNGECKMALAGGVNLSLHPCKYHMLGSYSFLSEQGRCTSFAADGTGYVPAEGVGAVLLKPLADAIRDHDKIYGVIKSTSMNHGGKTSGYTVPNPNAQAELIANALQSANIDPRTISYIEAHGTGTSLGDPIEVRGLQDAFEKYTQDKQFCAIGSVKSNIGHLESAAGISQLTKVLLQMQHKKLVASIHTEKLNPYINFEQSPFYVQRDYEDWLPENNYPRRAGISSFGAGGTNIHIIVEEYQAEKITETLIDIPLIFLLSASTKDVLKNYAKEMLHYLQTQSEELRNNNKYLQNICYTAQVGREAMSFRLAILPQNFDDLVNKLTLFIADDASHPEIKTSQVSHPQAGKQIDVSQYTCKEDVTELLHSWLNGDHVRWDLLYQQSCEKIWLPTYPFVKRRCWVQTNNVAVEKDDDHEKISWLIFNDQELGYHLQDELGKSACINCFSGKEYLAYEKNIFYLREDQQQDYEQVFNSIAKRKIKLQAIVFISSFLSAESLNKQSKLLSFINSLLDKDTLLCLITSVDQSDHQDSSLSIWKKNFSEQFATVENEKLLLINFSTTKKLRDQAKQITAELQNYSTQVNFVDFTDGGKETFRFSLLENSVSEENSVTVREEELNDLVMPLLAKLLQLDECEIDPEIPFLNYGMDSILGINFVGQLNEHFPDLLSPMDLYRYPTVNQLLAYIVENCKFSSAVAPSNLNDEDKFLAEINHLSDEEIADLLEKEIFEIDELLN